MFPYKVLLKQVILIGNYIAKLRINLSHSKYSQHVTKKNIWHEYSLFYKPTVQKFSKQPVSKGHCIEMTSNLWGRSKDVLGGLVKTPTSNQKHQICEPIVKLMKSTVTQEHIQLLVKKELISGYWAPCQSRGPARRLSLIHI